MSLFCTSLFFCPILFTSCRSVEQFVCSPHIQHVFFPTYLTTYYILNLHIRVDVTPKHKRAY